MSVKAANIAHQSALIDRLEARDLPIYDAVLLFRHSIVTAPVSSSFGTAAMRKRGTLTIPASESLA